MKTITINGLFGLDVMPQDFARQIDEANGEDITIDLSSIGGYLAPALAMHDKVKKYPGKKTVNLVGYVASSAAFFSTAFDVVKAGPTSIFMIHNAMSAVFGDFRAMDKESQNLKSLNNVLAQAYNKKSGKTTAEIIDLMNKESYFYGREILNAGFADELEGEEDNTTENKSDAIARVKAMISGLNLVNLMSDMHEAIAYLQAGDRKINQTIVNQLKDLISKGAINKIDRLESGDEALAPVKGFPFGKNGIVYLKAVQNAASRAGRIGYPELSSLAGEFESLINKVANSGNHRTGGMSVNIQEALDTLKNGIENAQIAIPKVAESLNMQALLTTPEQAKALQVVNKLAEMGIQDPIGFVTAAKQREESDAVAVRNAKLDKTFGPDKVNGKENFLRTYAAEKLGSVKNEELDAKIEEFRKDPLALKLAGENADIMSQINILDKSSVGDKNKPQGGLRVETW